MNLGYHKDWLTAKRSLGHDLEYILQLQLKMSLEVDVFAGVGQTRLFC